MNASNSAFSDEKKRAADELSKQIVGAAIEVHRHLGPGLLEETYEECLCRELDLRGIPYKRQLYLSLDYKGRKVENAQPIFARLRHTKSPYELKMLQHAIDITTEAQMRACRAERRA